VATNKKVFNEIETRRAPAPRMRMARPKFEAISELAEYEALEEKNIKSFYFFVTDAATK
jgi:hypothetical protein